MSRLYVAYGSNLNIAQMRRRCPNARVFKTGVLNNWQLQFRGSAHNAHATIVRKQGYTVPVLMWEITERDEESLDRYEGFPTYYYKENVFVELDTGRKKGMVYIMNPACKPGIPSASYVDTIEQGYIENGLNLFTLEEALR